MRGVLVLLGTMTCVLVPLAVGRLLARALAHASREEAATSAGREWLAGAIAAAPVPFVLLAMLVSGESASLLGSSRLAPVVATVLVLAAAVALGVVAAPFAFTPLVVLDERGGPLDATSRAFELAARRGARATAELGVALGGVIGAVPLLGAAIGWAAEPAVWLVAPLGCGVVVPGLTAWILARAYVEARALPAMSGAHEGAAARGVRTIVALLVPASLVLAVAVLAALFVPAPMGRIEGDEPLELGAPIDAVDAYGDRIALPGPHGVVIAMGAEGVDIAAADGGGAGSVRVRGGAPTGGELEVRRARYRGRDAFAVVLGDRATFVDERGVRLDDEPGDRLTARIGRRTAGVLLVALLLALAVLAQLGKAFGHARAIDAPVALPAGRRARAQLARIEGTLHAGAGARLDPSRRQLRTEGDARLVSRDGSIVIGLPREVPLLLPHRDATIASREDAILVARFDRLHPLGPREGASPWPAGARLVLGDRAEVALRLLARAARRSALWGLGTAALLVLAALTIAFQL